MKYVMSYELAPGGLELARVHAPAHRVRLMAFHARGVLLMAGPFTDDTGGALGIFTDRAAAEEFIRDDPFVTSGVVSRWTLREWREVLAPDPATMRPGPG